MPRNQQISKKSSTATTLLALLRPEKTDPLFIQHMKKASEFEQKTNLIASFLLKLWVPKKPDETTNFLPNYQPNSTSKTSTLTTVNINTQPIHHTSAEAMSQQFTQGNAQNFGALIFLNLILSGEFNPSTWGIACSPTSHAPFFTQKLSSFWRDLNATSTEPLFNLSRGINIELSRMIQYFQKKYPSWFSKFSNINNNTLFLNEIMEVSVRIYLTPEHLIKLIISDILTDETDAVYFGFYVSNKIKYFKNSFPSMLSKDQKIAWNNTLQQQGPHYVHHYCTDLTHYQRYQTTSTQDMCEAPWYSEYYNNIVHIKAIELAIPNMDCIHLLNDIQHTLLTRTHLINTLSYCMQRIDQHWAALMEDADYFLWSILEIISIRLSPHNGILFNSSHPNYLHVLLKGIEFNKNNIAILLLNQVQDCFNVPIPPDYNWLSNEHPELIGHSILYMACNYNNKIITRFLFSNGAHLLPEEQSPAYTTMLSASSEQAPLAHTATHQTSVQRRNRYSLYESELNIRPHASSPNPLHHQPHTNEDEEPSIGLRRQLSTTFTHSENT